MYIHSRARYIFLAIIFTMFSFSQAEAQLWGKLKSAVKDKAEKAVKKEVTKKAPQSSDKEKSTAKNQKKAQTASVKSTAQKQAANTQKNPPTIVTYQTGTPNGDLDIIGLRLGMSPSQAEAVLKAHNSDYKINYKKRSLHGIPNSDYVAHINASDEAFRSRKRGTNITLHFAPHPSKNKLLHISKATSYQNTGPTVEAFNKAFAKKYGNEFYSTKAAAKVTAAENAKSPMFIAMPETNNDIKIIRLNSGKKSTNEENIRCYHLIRNAVRSIRQRKNHVDVYEECGLLFATRHNSQHGIAVIASYDMSLTDFNELNKSHAKMMVLFQDHDKKVKQEKLDAAAKKDVDLF